MIPAQEEQMSNHPIVHIELSAQDPHQLGQFYNDLFGWKILHDEELNYTMFQTIEDSLGGGFSPVSADNPPGSVLVHIQTEDIDTKLEKIESHGGKGLVPKTEIPGTGWFAIFVDPSGNKVGLYTPMQSQE
jgi:predicted enzyme related to lactoylglutathione lyase